jgi:hypothetical protein
VSEYRFMGGESRGDGMGARGCREAKLQKQHPEAAPATGEDASPAGGGSVLKAEEDAK